MSKQMTDYRIRMVLLLVLALSGTVASTDPLLPDVMVWVLAAVVFLSALGVVVLAVSGSPKEK